MYKQIQLPPFDKNNIMFTGICSDQRQPHIRASNDRFIKLQSYRH